MGTCGMTSSRIGGLRRLVRKNKVILALTFLVAVQLLVLGFRLRPSVESPEFWPQVGDTLSGLTVQRSSGTNVPLIWGDPTVLLVFHSRCAHCADVAPLWADWIRNIESDWDVLAVSSEPLDSAQAFAKQQGWPVEVAVVDASSTGGPAHALTGRTPWIFAIDRAGVILSEGHGGRISELTAGVESGRSEVSGT